MSSIGFKLEESGEPNILNKRCYNCEATNFAHLPVCHLVIGDSKGIRVIGAVCRTCNQVILFAPDVNVEEVIK